MSTMTSEQSAGPLMALVAMAAMTAGTISEAVSVPDTPTILEAPLLLINGYALTVNALIILGGFMIACASLAITVKKTFFK